MGTNEGGAVGNSGAVASVRPLPALLSQVLVAFTVELDNEFERRMTEAGYAGALLSLMAWANLMRFVGERGVSVRDLAAQALAPEKGAHFMLGCLERWTFVVLLPDPGDQRPIPVRAHRLSGRTLRDGWGSGRGIRSGWLVQLTTKGRQASEIWPPLPEAIERRWEERFGKNEIGRLRNSLEHIAGQLDVELPQGLPYWEAGERFPARAERMAARLPLSALLSQLLLAFRIEFDAESRAPLPLCANTLRVLEEGPLRAAEIPRLTGGSPETTDVGWQIKPYLVVEPDPAASRGKVIRLSPRGLLAQQIYHRLVGDLETRWGARFGKQQLGNLREALHGLFEAYRGDRPLVAEGLVPAPGTVRAAGQTPHLGRRGVGPAQRQRMRDMVAQTEAFVRDPAGALPHYPLWDMNRGFGP